MDRQIIYEIINILLIMSNLIFDFLKQVRIKTSRKLVLLLNFIKHIFDLSFLFINLIIILNDLSNRAADEWKQDYSDNHHQHAHTPFSGVVPTDISVSHSCYCGHCKIKGDCVNLHVGVIIVLVCNYPIIVLDWAVCCDKIFT